MTGDGKVAWIALGMDSVARNYLRACVWVSVLCCLSLHFLNSFCLSLLLALGSSVTSWRGMTLSACLGGETQGSWGFLGIQLSYLLPWCWSWLWFLKWSENSALWWLLLSVGAELLLHPLLKCMGILTRMHWLADLYARCCCDVFLLGLPSAGGAAGRWGWASVALALLLATACWAQASLQSIF